MRKLLTILALAVLGASGSVFAQSSPAKAPPVALKGNDPVSYFTQGHPVKGASTINYDFDESRYLFSSPKNKETFASNPDRYTPQFGGLCATGLSMGMKAEADPRVFKIVDGKLYVFSSTQALEMVEKDPSLLKKAHESWQHKK